VADRLRQLVPQARVAVAHGQMAEGPLDKVMLGFVDHEFDILVATTIVESGLDIPNANTMFINDAENYGLADLHQLRGRVGRYKHRAYCYLLVDRGKMLASTAAQRLKAIEEFSSIGAGFGIAMRDLEIRGAGNILGTQQSGHIAAVGYELYCTLLEQAVRRLANLPPKERVEVHLDLRGEAYLPRRYVPDMRLKIDLYRRISRVTTDAELDALAAEILDRFGRPPDVAQRMIELARLRLWAFHWRISAIRLDGPNAVLDYKDKNRIAELVLKSRAKVRVVDGRQAYFTYRKGAAEDPDVLIEDLKSLLLPR
jgi:transcription-repair coupling factor (superfamily II helicase)